MSSITGNIKSYWTETKKEQNQGGAEWAGGYSLRMARKIFGLKSEEAIRTCLNCRIDFKSYNRGHRLCDRCKFG